MNNFFILKKYDNNFIDIKDKEKDKKINEFIKINEHDAKNYVINNLMIEYKNNAYIPLEILLLRNQSLSFFEKIKNNFLN